MQSPIHSDTAAARYSCAGSVPLAVAYGIIGALLVTACPSFAQSNTQATQASSGSLCPIIEAAAQANALPVDFFARLIWRESRFQPDAVGPLTRSGEHALGIAQFMPETAAEQQLLEPFDPKQALPKSSALLAELRAEFGNLGLAAAAYNAGSQRVRDFLAGSRGLPDETRNYVLAITGHPVEEWMKAPDLSLTQSKGEADTSRTDCNQLLASLERQRPISLNVPSWCRGLNHPNTSICGPIHASESFLRAVVMQSGRRLHSPRSSL